MAADRAGSLWPGGERSFAALPRPDDLSGTRPMIGPEAEHSSNHVRAVATTSHSGSDSGWRPGDAFG